MTKRSRVRAGWRCALAAASGLVLAGALAACGGDVSGTGSAASRAATSAAATPPRASTSPTGSGAVSSDGGGGSGGGAGGGATASGSRPAATTTVTRTATPSGSPTPIGTTPAPSSSPPGQQGQVLSVTARSYCTGHDDPNGYAQLAYRTTGGSHAFVVGGAVARISDDAKRDGGREIDAPNGSVQMPFDCTGDHDTYRIDVYNVEGHGGMTFDVSYNA